MNIYESSSSPIHFTRMGFVRIGEYKDISLTLPRGDERILTVQGRSAIVVRTKRGKKFRLYADILNRNPLIHDGWMRLPIAQDDMVTDAGVHGPLWRQEAELRAQCEKLVLTECSLALTGGSIDVEQVRSLDRKDVQLGEHEWVEEMPLSNEIRFFRIPFVPDEVLPQILSSDDYRERIVALIGKEEFDKFPQSSFNKPDIAVLHGQLMKAALRKDGVPIDKIARQIRSMKYDDELPSVARWEIEKFLNLVIVDARSKEFHFFMRWVIDHGYTLNHIIHRRDADSLVPREPVLSPDPVHEKRGVSFEFKNKLYDRLVRSNLLAMGYRTMAKVLGLNEELSRRLLEREKWRDISDDNWKRIAKSLDAYFSEP